VDLSFKNTKDSVRRADVLRRLRTTDVFDIVIAGGGIHGAAVARIAAACGLKVALCEKADYASATSSRSSKMAHGGLRYLELFDFEQVLEGIKAREEMFEYMGNLVRPARFLIPVPKGKWFFKLKLGLGLSLYDLLVRNGERRHRWLRRENLDFPGFHRDRTDLMGCYLYTDGIMSDARLVIDTLIAARRAGAVCLNYCEVKSLSRDTSTGISTVRVLDSISNEEINIRARLVVNCAGPWASALASALGSDPKPLRFSRGSHIIFNKPWVGPSLFLPLEGRARYYFVWPHPAGTLVGTTEREVSHLELDPIPSHDEIEEILTRLAKDIPEAGLTRETACYAFAGIRTLPIRSQSAHSAEISRKHIWTHANGVLTLLGGKYTTASWTALEGVVQAAGILGRPLSKKALKNRIDLKTLPGSSAQEELTTWTRKLDAQGVSPDAIKRLLTRYGKRLADDYLDLARGDDESVVALETAIALDTEQVETVEDLMRRRLELEYGEGHGERYLPVIKEVFNRLRPEIPFDEEVSKYRERMAKIQTLLKIPAA
jgi:glycerol-3-phosphate dehydrogenase